MALRTLNGYTAEEATSAVVYENVIPAIQHINGRGCVDKYTPSNDVRNVTSIDVERIKPMYPIVRQLGASTNGGFANNLNVPMGGNGTQATKYRVDVDLFYDRMIPVPAAQLFANTIEFKSIVMQLVVKTMAWAINIVTFAKQFERFFRNGDNFDKALTHDKGAVVAGDITTDEMSKALFTFDSGEEGSRVKQFVLANATLSDDGVPEVGALTCDVDERQAFITDLFNAGFKSQYSTNASEAAAQINATGFINPFTQSEGVRINSTTGLRGMYDGVPLFQFNGATRAIMYQYLGLVGSAGDVPACKTALNKIEGIIIYGKATLRGIAYPPSIEVTKDPYNAQSVNILPLMKMGVDVLHGASIKMLVNGGAGGTAGITAEDIAKLINTLKFTPVQDNGATNIAELPRYDFNDGTTK